MTKRVLDWPAPSVQNKTKHMANKSTRQLRRIISAAGKKGQDEVQHKQCVPNYHSRGTGDDFRAKPDSFFVNVSFPTARVKGDGVNSVNKKRNSCQRVSLNQNEHGQTSSLTSHEPWIRHEHMVFKNHHQYKNFEYRRSAGPAASNISA